MKVLVTGGAGFIGSHLADELLSRGDRVAVIDNLSTGQRENIAADISLHEVDIRDRDAVAKTFASEKPDVVFHLAAQADVRRSMAEPTYDAAVNVEGTLNLLDASQRVGVSRFVFASTGGAVYGEPETLPVSESHAIMPLSVYGASKAAAELYLGVYRSGFALKTTVLRFANVYGPRQNPKGEAGVVAIFSTRLLRGEPCTIFGDGSKTRDYVYVGDVVKANLAALDQQADGVFNVGTGVRTSDQQVFDAVREATAVDAQPVYGPRRAGEVEHIALTAAHAKLTLGWEPTMGFKDGVERSVAYYRAHL